MPEYGVFYATGVKMPEYIPTRYKDTYEKTQTFTDPGMAQEYCRKEQKGHRRKGFRCPLEVRRLDRMRQGS